MLIQGSGKRDDKKELLDLFERLGEEARRSLFDYAEFLASRCQPKETIAIEPKPIPRPEEESVIEAIKRLSDSYHMLDRSQMLHETAGLMTQHVMQGREASEVIDELEILFRKYYEKQFGGSE